LLGVAGATPIEVAPCRGGWTCGIRRRPAMNVTGPMAVGIPDTPDPAAPQDALARPRKLLALPRRLSMDQPTTWRVARVDATRATEPPGSGLPLCARSVLEFAEKYSSRA